MDTHHQDRHHGVQYHKHNSGQHSHENGHIEHDAIARNYSVDSLREHWYRQGHHTRRRSSIAHRAIKVTYYKLKHSHQLDTSLSFLLLVQYY